MMHSCRCLVALACAVLASPALAQTTTQSPARPYRGLFGGARPIPARARFLDLVVSLSGGYDDNLAMGAPGTVTDPRYQVQGSMASGNAELSYRRGAREHDWFRAGAWAGFRRYPTVSAWNAREFGGDVGFSSMLGRRVVIRAQQAVARQPFLRMEAIPGFGGSEVPSYDYGVVKRDSVSYQTTAETRFEIGRKTFLLPKYSLAGVEMLRSGDAGYQRAQNAGVSLTMDRWRRTSLGGDYSYVTDKNSYTGPLTIYRTHNVAAMLGYRRTFRGQRQVSFNVRPGIALAEVDTPSVGRYSENRATAAATARVDITRTWSWTVDYERGYNYLPGFGDPFFTDNVRTTIAGFMVRRVDMAFGVAYSNGSVGYIEKGGYGSLSGTAQMRVAVNRTVAISGQALYYSYEFGAGVPLPPGYSTNFDRVGFRVGFELWLPMMR